MVNIFCLLRKNRATIINALFSLAGRKISVDRRMLQVCLRRPRDQIVPKAREYINFPPSDGGGGPGGGVSLKKVNR